MELFNLSEKTIVLFFFRTSHFFPICSRRTVPKKPGLAGVLCCCQIRASIITVISTAPFGTEEIFDVFISL